MATTDGPVAGKSVSIRSEVSERLWVLIVAGIPTGVLVAGLGSRLAMLVLGLTSPDSVVGVTSDDGFEIGRFTLGGTYNLLMLGAVVGVIGAAAYRAVQPWLLGPNWFRRLTVAAGSGAVVGSMLIHADGIDFRVLKPTWLAVGLFVALPALFGAVLGVVVDRVSAIAVPPGWRRWGLPTVLVAAFPLAIVVVGIVAAALVVWVPVRRRLDSTGGLPKPAGLGVRAVWLLIALAGLAALVGDVRALT
ncbi:MAG: hypothetical protein ACKVWR_17930 [Acidimicrobiales bacterium]